MEVSGMSKMDVLEAKRSEKDKCIVMPMFN